MANVGLGSINANTNEAKKAYENIAQYAKDKGVQISVLAIGVRNI